MNIRILISAISLLILSLPRRIFFLFHLALVMVFIQRGEAHGLSQNTGATAKEISYTLEDRDRIIRLEQQVQSLRNEIKSEISSLRNEMMTKFDTLYWAFGIMLSFMFLLFGYIIWDRKTAMEPLREKSYSMSEKYTNLIRALSEYAKENPKLSEILKTHGIL